MAIIRIIQKVKIFSLYSIKRLFKRILFFTILISIPNNFVVADENNLEYYFCDVSNAKLLEEGVISLSFKDKNFNQVISNIEKKSNNGEFNLLVTTGQKSSSGYSLEFIKIKKKKKFDQIYFKEMKPKKKSTNLAVITHPFCLLKVKNLNSYKIKIKKQRFKLFSFSVFH